VKKVWDAAAHAERFAIGLDIGQQVDYSALAVVSLIDTPLEDLDPRTGMLKFDSTFFVKWLERPALGTAFSTVVKRAVELRNDSALGRKAVTDDGRVEVLRPPIVIDGTGIGAPLVEMFQRNHNVRVVPVIITGGQELNAAHGRFRVPKQDLVAALSVVFEMQQIKIASGLDLSDDLLGELKNFRMQTNAGTGHSTYDAKPGTHDDLLIAVALGVWWLEEQRRHTIGTVKIVGV
jgi:hypothetical protein